MHLNLVYYVLAFLTLYLTYRLLWKRLVAYLQTHFGLRVNGLGLVSVSGLSFKPPQHGKPSTLSLSRLKVDLIGVSFHRPTSSGPWASIRVVGVLVALDLSPKPSSATKSTTKKRARVQSLQDALQKQIESFSSLLRNSFLRALLRVVDVSVDDVQVVVCDELGKEIVKYQQENLKIAFMSQVGRQGTECGENSSTPTSADVANREIGTSEGSGASGNGTPPSPSDVPPSQPCRTPANFRVLLSVSPLKITSPAESVDLLSTATVSTISLAAHTTVMFTRFARPEVEVQINGLSVSTSGIMALKKNFAPKSSSNQDVEVDHKSHQRDPPDTQDEVEDILRDLKTRLQQLSVLRPRVSVQLSQMTVTHAYPSFLSILISFDSISLTSSIISPAKTWDTHLVVTGLAVDICDAGCAERAVGVTSLDVVISVPIPTREKEVDARFRAVKMRLMKLRGYDDGTPAEVDGKGGDEKQTNGVKVACQVQEPRVILSDVLIGKLLDLAKSGPSRATAPSPPSQGAMRAQPLFLALSLHYAPRLTLTIPSVLISIRMTTYSDPYRPNKHAEMTFGIEEIALSVQGNEASVNGEFGVGRMWFGAGVVDHDWVGLLEGEVREGGWDEIVVCGGTRCSVGMCAPGENGGKDGELEIDVQVGDLKIDLGLVACSTRVDYFSLGVVGSSLLARVSGEKDGSASSPVEAEILVPPVQHRSGIKTNVTTQSISILLVSESGASCLAASVSSISFNHHISTSSTLSSTQAKLSNVSVRTIGSYNPASSSLGDAVDDVLSVRSITVTQLEEGMDVNIDKLSIGVSLRSVYVGIVASVYSIKLAKLFDRSTREGEEGVRTRRRVRSPTSPRKAAGIKLHVEDMNVGVCLPDDVRVQLRIRPFTMLHAPHKPLTTLSAPLVTFLVETNKEEGRFEPLLSFSDACVRIGRSEDGGRSVECEAKTVDVLVPYGYQIADVVENGVNFMKGTKQILATSLGIATPTPISPISPTPATSHGTPHPANVPLVKVAIGRLKLELLDDPFEASLGRNFVEGVADVKGRVARDRAFWKKARSLRDRIVELESAWWLLQEHNSNLWISRIKKSNSATGGVFPPLMTATLNGLVLEIRGPTVLAPTIEEALHVLDSSTPATAHYDELIPRDITLTLTSCNFSLRDYPNPIFHIPDSKTSRPALRTTGLLIIAEQITSAHSKRHIALPLSLPNAYPVQILRAIAPTKLYTSLTTHLTPPPWIPVTLCWGACIEGVIADTMGVVDTFTKPNVDPSPPIGWWDKMRLIFHGGHTVSIGGGGVVVKVLGGMSPRGSEGVEWVMGKGVGVRWGQDVGETVVIECGEFGWRVFEDSEGEGYAKLEGGVRVEPLNSLTLSPQLLSHLHRFLQTYQSPLTNVPVRRGSVFATYYSHRAPSAAVEAGKPKLGRCIGSIRLVCSMYPLVLGYTTELEMGGGGVGVRGRAEKMDVDMTFVQRSVKGPGDAEHSRSRASSAGVGGSDATTKGSKAEKRKPTTKWNLTASEIEVTDIEARTVAYGRGIVYLSSHPPSSASFSSFTGFDDLVDATDMCDLSSDRDWILDSDYTCVEDVRHIRMVPFGWSPKVIYYKHGGDAEGEGEWEGRGRSEKDIYAAQIHLFQYRLREIEGSIRHYLEVLKKLQHRLREEELKRDRESSVKLQHRLVVEELKQQTDVVLEKLSILHEKKAVIDGYISKCERRRDDEDHFRFLPLLHPHSSSTTFDHHYIVHNIKLLWKQNVRNTIFKLLDLQQRSSGINYCLSNAAVRAMRQLVSAVSKRKTEGENPQGQGDANAPTGNFTPSMAEELLAKLVAEEETSFVVPNETEVVETTGDSGDEGNGEPTANPDSSSRSAFTAHTTYVPSRDPESPDYVADDQLADSDYIIQLVNPQINLEAGSKENPTQLQAVVVAAESMQVQSILILDATRGAVDEYRDRAEEIIKRRMILKIHNAQFFVARQVDIHGAAEVDGVDNIVMHGSLVTRAGSEGNIAPPASWPTWAPLECLIDHGSHTGHLRRVVEHTSASMHRDKPNPLYMKSRKGASLSEGGSSGATKVLEHDTFHINFPTFVISVDSAQYLVISDVISNLLIYRDPARGERNERLKKMLLALEQMEDLRTVQESVLILQEKIRHAESLLKLDGAVVSSSASSFSSSSSSETQESKQAEVRRCLVQYQDEIIVIIDAMKELQSLERKRKSVGVAYQVLVSSGKLVWHMMLDSGQPLCLWTLTKSQFWWVQNEDQSSVTTLEMEQLHVENTMYTPGSGSFRDVISAYVPDRRAVDFSRHKMLRVYMRELAPVAGIQVVDHFEINIYPLLIQMTYDTGKQIMYYIFPEKRARAAAKAQAAQNRPLTSSITDLEKAAEKDASDQNQHTVRTFRSVENTAPPLASLKSLSATSYDDLSALGPPNNSHHTRRGSMSDMESLASPSPSTLSAIDTDRKRRARIITSDAASVSSGISSHSKAKSESAGSSATHATPTYSSKVDKDGRLNELLQMQARASQNRSFIYIKVPGVQHCLSYKGPKEKNLEDLYMFAFKMPTLEYRNKTWTWLDVMDAVKKDAIRAVLANTGALVRDKLFQKRKPGSASNSLDDMQSWPSPFREGGPTTAVTMGSTPHTPTTPPTPHVPHLPRSPSGARDTLVLPKRPGIKSSKSFDSILDAGRGDIPALDISLSADGELEGSEGGGGQGGGGGGLQHPHARKPSKGGLFEKLFKGRKDRRGKLGGGGSASASGEILADVAEGGTDESGGSPVASIEGDLADTASVVSTPTTATSVASHVSVLSRRNSDSSQKGRLLFGKLYGTGVSGGSSGGGGGGGIIKSPSGYFEDDEA
ncbi:hypothetical protein HK104_005429 [Borealophlyctis nickersoniae]|nr:hypothetical protein HK104_005429 [Borealophlyctis nickersoniae]